MIPTKEQAWDLLCEYNEGEFHRLHARIVGDVMRYFAVQLGYADEADFWQTVGILHDLDFEQYPDQHCTKEAEILREKGVDERLIHAVVSHGYLLTVDCSPSTRWRRSSTLRTSSRASSAPSCGCCRRRVCRICSPSPSRKSSRIRNLPPAARARSSSAARTMLGWTLDELMEQTIAAMQASPAANGN